MPKDSKSSSRLPPLFLSRMQALLGEDFIPFEQSYSRPSQAGLRVNTLKLSARQYQELSSFSLAPIPWCSSGYLIPPDVQPGKHAYHAAGLYYLQEPSAMAVAEVLAPLPGERVLDLSAAPGGKTTHLAALMQNQGLLVANEIHPKRVWDLAENIERFGIRIAGITNETPERLAHHFGPFFDRVLLDAPCSGEGMFRKSGTARSQWSPEHVHSCALRQQAILRSAANLVRPGGSLVYSTCTFSPDENEMTIGSFLQDHPDFIMRPIPENLGFSHGVPAWAHQYRQYPLEHTIRIWPHHSVGEGHFIARLQRTDHPVDEIYPKSPPPTAEYTALPPQLVHQFHIFLDETMTGVNFTTDLLISGSYLYQLPSPLFYRTDIKWIHPGWWLGIFKKGRFEPSHALALGLTSSQAQRTHALSSDEPAMLAYLRGESLPSPGKDGWTLVTVDDFPVGWGKRVQNVLKNAYPHGLRWR